MARMRGLLIGSLMMASAVQGLSISQNYWQSHLDVAGQTTSWRKGAGTYLFMPILQDPCQLLFGQAKGGHFLDSWIGSAGVGYRKLQSRNWAWGVNAFFDISRSDNHLTHVQGGAGAEIFGRCWEARINGYFPSLKRKIVKTEQVTDTFMDGTQLFQADYTRKIQEAAYQGVDAEIGYGLDVCHGSLWGYAGYYYFSTNKQRSFDGPRLRVEYRLDNVLGWCGVQALAGVIWEHDQVHGNKTSISLGFRVPLGGPAKSDCCSPSSIYRRMGNRIRRMESIVIAEQIKRVNQVNTPIMSPDGTPLQIFFATQNGRGRGSLEEPTSLKKVGELANPYDHIVLVGDQNIETLTLKDHQSLLGFGSNESLTITLPSGPIAFSDDRGRAHIKGEVKVADNNKLSGFSLEGNIVGEGLSNTHLSDLSVTASKGDAISLTGGKNTTIHSVVVRDAGGQGMVIDGHNTRVSNVIIERSKLAGMVVANTTIEDVRIRNAKEEGLIIRGGNVRIDSLEVTNSGKTALKIENSTGVSADKLFLNSHGDGLHITDSVGSIHLGQVQIRAQERGVYLARNAATINMGVLDVVSKRAALFADQQNGLLTTHKGSLTANGGPALHLKGANVDLSTLSLISKNSSTPGIYLKNVAGKLDVQGGFIDTGIKIKGGAPIFSYNGAISNTPGNVIDISGVKGGSISLHGTHAGLLGKSISIENSNCEVQVSGAELTDTITRTAHTGHFSLLNSRVKGLRATDAAGLTLKNVTFTKANTAIELQNVYGAHLIQGIKAHHLKGYGTVLRCIPSGNTSLTFNQNQCIGATEGDEVSIGTALDISIDKPLDFSLHADGNTFSALRKHAIILNTEGGAIKTTLTGNTIENTNGSPAILLNVSNGHFDYDIAENQLTNSDTTPIVINTESSSSSEMTIHGHLAHNTFRKTGRSSQDAAILLKTNLRSYSDRMDVTIERNNNISGRSAIAIGADILSKGTTNLTLKGNVDHGQPFGTAYKVMNSGPGDLHLHMEGNQSERVAPATLLINKGSGRFVTNKKDAKTHGNVELN